MLRAVARSTAQDRDVDDVELTATLASADRALGPEEVRWVLVQLLEAGFITAEAHTAGESGKPSRVLQVRATAAGLDALAAGRHADRRPASAGQCGPLAGH